MPSPYPVTFTYRPMPGLVTWLYSLIGTSIGLYALALVTKTLVIYFQPAIIQMQHMSMAEQMAQMQRFPPDQLLAVMGMSCTSCADLAVRAAGYVLFLIWIYRVAVNARALGVSGLRFSPQTCVICMLPLINLVMAPLVLMELANAHDRSGGRAGRLALGWWASMLGAVVMSMIIAVAINPQLSNRPDLLLPLSAGQLTFGVAHLIIALLLVRRIQQAQTAAAGNWQPANSDTGALREPWDD
ncbi:MAG: DUF4328 domain-containing protein [Phycisphaeraceae bacterium]|nr:DUF4328 domain-containing protein [Phycisphaeraceae bacterium]